jgi:hypothetical protein
MTVHQIDIPFSPDTRPLLLVLLLHSSTFTSFVSNISNASALFIFLLPNTLFNPLSVLLLASLSSRFLISFRRPTIHSFESASATFGWACIRPSTLLYPRFSSAARYGHNTCQLPRLSTVPTDSTLPDNSSTRPGATAQLAVRLVDGKLQSAFLLSRRSTEQIPPPRR